MTDAQRMWTLVAVTAVGIFLFWLVSALWRAILRARQRRIAQAQADEVQNRIWAAQHREENVCKNQRHKRDPWLQKIGYFWRRR
jgi:flagellar biosynthesis/type III secretory pathway M-ring protein FliF/YscJ